MSRVFDALQEAARRSGAIGNPTETVWKELGIDPTVDLGIGKKRDESVRENPVAGFSGDVSTISAIDVLKILPAAGPERGSGPPPVGSIAEIPTTILLDQKARLIPHTPERIVLERYRMLRTKILQERGKRFFRSLVVTSPNPQEGKTLTVMNLALSFAALPSFKLLVIDGDMRRGALGDWLGLPRGLPGLSNLIEGSARTEDVLLKSDELGLHLIPRGNVRVSDLEPSQFSAHFRELIERFDLVLVDSPPVNLITDVQIMATSCDAVLLVARAFSTTSKSLQEAVEKLQSFRLIGTVLNAGPPRRSRKYPSYYSGGDDE